VPDEVTTLVPRRTKPDELAFVEDGVEKHHPLDHPSPFLSGGVTIGRGRFGRRGKHCP
jgi:hypothetical protein